MAKEMQVLRQINLALEEENRFLKSENQQLKKMVAELRAKLDCSLSGKDSTGPARTPPWLPQEQVTEVTSLQDVVGPAETIRTVSDPPLTEVAKESPSRRQIVVKDSSELTKRRFIFDGLYLFGFSERSDFKSP